MSHVAALKPFLLKRITSHVPLVGKCIPPTMALQFSTKNISATQDFPLTSPSHGGCGTAYETNLLPCSTSTPSKTTTATLSTITTKPVSCVTLTKTDGPNCSKISPQTCITLDCIIESTVTNPCGCTGIVETTSCRTTCPGGCATAYKTLFLPCAITPPVPSATPV